MRTKTIVAVASLGAVFGACTTTPGEHNTVTQHPVNKVCFNEGETITFQAELPDRQEDGCIGRPSRFLPRAGGAVERPGPPPRMTGVDDGPKTGFAVDVPAGLPPGTYYVQLDCGGPSAVTNTFEIPCPSDGGPADTGAPNAGTDAASDGPITTTGGRATTLKMPKTDTLNGGTLAPAANGKVILTASAGDANVTVVDPAAPESARQVVIASNNVASAVERGDGSIMVAGFLTGLTPWVGLLKTDNTFAWARDFGAGAGRAGQIAKVGVNDFAVVFGGSLKVARIDAAGGVPTIVSFTTPAKTYARAIGALAGGGYLVGAEIERTFPEQDLVLFAVSPANDVAWQKLFANGGRNFFHSTLSTADGGALVVGGIRPVGQAAFDGWLARFSSAGALAWQRSYSSGTAIQFKAAVETTNGFRVVGATTAGLTVLDLASDGAPLKAVTYADSGATPRPVALGLDVTQAGGVVIAGVEPTTHTYTLVRTAPDLTVPGCGDAAIGAPASTSVASSTAPTLTITDATFAVTAATPASNTVTLTTSTTPSVERVDLCSN